jgi:hypothetical protein
MIADTIVPISLGRLSPLHTTVRENVGPVRRIHRSAKNLEYPLIAAGSGRIAETAQGALGPIYFVATTMSSYQTVRVVPPPART